MACIGSVARNRIEQHWRMLAPRQRGQQRIDVWRPRMAQSFGYHLCCLSIRSRVMRRNERRRIAVEDREINRLGEQTLMIVQRGLRLAIIIGGMNRCIIAARKR